MNVVAPLPPLRDTAVGINELGNITPANGVSLAEAEQAKSKSCKFSKYQRKNALGYEIDPSQHIALTVSPSFDVFDPTDFETKVSLRFTRAFGGEANKRPDCTYGSGFYGLIPYAGNEGVHLGGLMESENIKSYAKDKLEERERRRQEREAKLQMRAL